MAEPLINLPFTKTDGVNTLHDALGEAGLEVMRQQRFIEQTASAKLNVGYYYYYY